MTTNNIMKKNFLISMDDMPPFIERGFWKEDPYIMAGCIKGLLRVDLDPKKYGQPGWDVPSFYSKDYILMGRGCLGGVYLLRMYIPTGHWNVHSKRNGACGDICSMSTGEKW